jgi:hypothetical protein
MEGGSMTAPTTHIDAYVNEVRGRHSGNDAPITVSASYESASIISAITFTVAAEHAREWYVGRHIVILISESDVEPAS